MKNKLDAAREIINEVDKEMIDLFIKRMAAVKMVAEYKIEEGLPVLDSSRENIIWEKNLKLLNHKELEEYYKTFFNGVLTSSKDFQLDLIKKHGE